MPCRLHIHPDHKYWLKSILQPIKDKVVIVDNETNTSKLLNIGSPPYFYFTNCSEYDLVVNSYAYDPRGFYYNKNEIGTELINNEVYADYDINNISFYCDVCNNRFLNNLKHDSGCCINCVSKIKKIRAKSIRDWTSYKLKLDNEPEDSIYFGIEFEYCVESGMDPFDIANEANKKIMDEFGKPIPAFICSDSSLTNGAELNFWPMTLAYYMSVKHIIEKFIDIMREKGISYGCVANEEFKEQAGIHIHVTNPCDSNQNVFNKYENMFKHFFVKWSGRSLDKYDRYCGGYFRLFSKRNNDSTWEYRGYSSKNVINNPSLLLLYIQFVNLMRACIDNISLLTYPLNVLCEKFGYIELSKEIKLYNNLFNENKYLAFLEYIKNVLDISNIAKYNAEIFQYLSIEKYDFVKYNEKIFLVENLSESEGILYLRSIANNSERFLLLRESHVTVVKFDENSNKFVDVELNGNYPVLEPVDIDAFPYGNPTRFYDISEQTDDHDERSIAI